MTHRILFAAALSLGLALPMAASAHSSHDIDDMSDAELIEAEQEIKEGLEEIKEGRQEVAEELADVALYLLQLASIAEIDLEQAILDKLEVNASREWD